ncbi:MAG TPA: response regulator transcription factor [Flavobacterium sp.]|jgi:two-component system nitrate/nitrite response regulator NarL
MIKVLIVEDHDLFAEGIKSLFNSPDGIEIVCHTRNGNAIPAILESMDIDIILMDIDMPILDGISCMELLKSKGHDKPILMLTMHQSFSKVKAALEKGAQGYILKDASKAELMLAINRTFQRLNYFHPKINDQIFDYFRTRNIDKHPGPNLSEREKEIIKHVANGLNTKAISVKLFISEHTVKTHRRNIMQKLQVKTSAELIKLAIDEGII